MHRIGLALGLIVLAVLPANSQWTPPDADAQTLKGFWPESRDGVPGIRFSKFDGAAWQEVWQPLSANTCRDVANERRRWVWGMPDNPIYNTSDVSAACKQSNLVKSLTNDALYEIDQWYGYCQWWARDYAAYSRSERLDAGSRSAVAGSYSAQKIPAGGGAGGSAAVASPSQARSLAVPDSGGAGGSEATVFGAQPAFSWKAGPEPVPSGGAGGSEAVSPQSQPSAMPDGGGAGGSERTRIASAPATAQAPPQVCDPKTFGDAELRLLLADPRIRARLASLMAEEPGSQKTKTGEKATRQQDRRGKRVRAPTDADHPVAAEPGSGMSPEAANTLGTMIGIGTSIGLSNIGRRGGGAGAPPSAPTSAPQRTTPSATQCLTMRC